MTDTPTARRSSAPGWRDPRLWIGVALVAASVLAGAIVLGTSDDTVAVWAATDTMGPGHALTADDLTVRQVGFPDLIEVDDDILGFISSSFNAPRCRRNWKLVGPIGLKRPHSPRTVSAMSSTCTTSARSVKPSLESFLLSVM